MSPTPGRSWQVIAEELSKEKDSQRIAQLADELSKALDAKPASPTVPRPDPTRETPDAG